MALPPGPTTPFLLRLPKLMLQPLAYLEDYSDRYGPIFKVGRGSNPVIYVADPAALQTIFRADPDQFVTGGGTGILQALLGDHSLILLDGDRHRRQRQLLLPPFHGDRLRSYGQLISDTTRTVISGWPPNRPLPLRPAMQEITLRVILQAVFGLQAGARFDQLRQALTTLLDGLSHPVSAFMVFLPALQRDFGPWSPWGRFLRLKRVVDELIYAQIQDRRLEPAGNGSDVLSLMMAARDEQGLGMSDDELHDELMTLLIAGHETTASALCWALYWILALPAVKTRLDQELATLDGAISAAAIAQLPYLSAVCQETLRIYPVTLTTGVRILKAPLSLGAYELAPGTVLFPCIYLIHHDPDLYPESQRFRPERFLERSYSSYEYPPFGGGHRSCIGSAFALMEMKLVLATILRRWQLALVRQPLLEGQTDRQPNPLQPVRRGITMAPPSHLRVRVCPPRRAPQ